MYCRLQIETLQAQLATYQASSPLLRSLSPSRAAAASDDYTELRKEKKLLQSRNESLELQLEQMSSALHTERAAHEAAIKDACLQLSEELLSKESELRTERLQFQDQLDLLHAEVQHKAGLLADERELRCEAHTVSDQCVEEAAGLLQVAQDELAELRIQLRTTTVLPAKTDALPSRPDALTAAAFRPVATRVAAPVATPAATRAAAPVIEDQHLQQGSTQVLMAGMESRLGELNEIVFSTSIMLAAAEGELRQANQDLELRAVVMEQMQGQVKEFQRRALEATAATAATENILEWLLESGSFEGHAQMASQQLTPIASPQETDLEYLCHSVVSVMAPEAMAVAGWQSSQQWKQLAGWRARDRWRDLRIRMGDKKMPLIELAHKHRLQQCASQMAGRIMTQGQKRNMARPPNRVAPYKYERDLAHPIWQPSAHSSRPQRAASHLVPEFYDDIVSHHAIPTLNRHPTAIKHIQSQLHLHTEPTLTSNSNNTRSSIYSKPLLPRSTKSPKQAT